MLGKAFLLHIPKDWVLINIFAVKGSLLNTLDSQLSFCTSFPCLLSTIKQREQFFILSKFDYIYADRFSGLAAHYKDLHLGDFDDAYLESSGERLNPTAKRIAEGWLCYSLVEIKQRYNIRG